MSDFDPAILRPGARKLYDYWRSKCVGGRLPARADIDPLEVPLLMPVMYLVDVERADGELRFRMRLVGTEVNTRFGRDSSGTWADEDEPLRKALPDFQAAVEGRTPHYTSSARYTGKEHIGYDRLILPLAGDGETVDMLVGVLCFD